MTFCIGGTMKPLPSKQSGMCRGDLLARRVAQEAFDKMSNEGVETVRACTKIRFGGFRGILRRFAKYGLPPVRPEYCHAGRSQALCLSRLTSSAS